MKNLGAPSTFMESRNRKSNKSERNVLRARRGVVKMLVLVSEFELYISETSTAAAAGRGVKNNTQINISNFGLVLPKTFLTFSFS